MNETVVCVDDFDCDDNYLCFTGVSWFEEYNLELNSTDNCACNSWYAWTGDSCDEFSAATWVNILFNFVSICIGLLNCAVLAICAMEFKKSGKQRLCSFNTTSITIFLSFVSSLHAAWWALVQALSTGLTRGAPLLPYEKYLDIYKGRWNFVSNFVAPIATFCAALALLTISLMWIEISLHSGRLTPVSQSRLAFTRKVIYGFVVGAVLLGTLGAIVEKSTGKVVMGYFISPLIVLVIMTYLAGAHKLNQILQGSSSMRNHYVIPNESSRDLNTGDDSKMNTTEGRPTASSSFDYTRPSGRENTTTLASPGATTMGSSSRNLSSSAPSRATSVMKNSTFFRILRRIRNTSVMVCLTLTLFMFSYLCLSIIDSTTGWKELTRPATLTFVKIVHNNLMLSTALTQSVVAYYVFESVSSPSKSRR